MLHNFIAAATAHGILLHPYENKIISDKTSIHNNAFAVHEMHIEILHPGGTIKYLGQIITFKKRCPSRVMRVGSLHEPRTSADITKIATEGQAETLRRTRDAISSFRHRKMDDDRGNEAETTDNATHEC